MNVTLNLPVVVLPSAPVAVDCQPSAPQSTLPQMLYFLPTFRTAPMIGQLNCELRAGTSDLVGSTLSVEVQSTVWPTFDDAVVTGNK